MHFITMKLLKSIHTLAGAPSGLIRLPSRVNRNTLFPGPVPKKKIEVLGLRGKKVFLK